MISSNGYPDRWKHLFSPIQDIDGPICMNRTIKWIFLSYLLSLQFLSLIWFGMVVRVAVGVVYTGNAEDTRSDDEEEEGVQTTTRVVAGKDPSIASSSTTDSSSADWRRSNGSATVRTRGRGRVRLADQSDRKALLGRIGCEKPTS